MADLRLPNLRQVLVAGRLGQQPELRYLASGTAVATASLAVDCYRGKGADGKANKDTLWLDVDCFGKTAEIAAALPKGAPVIVEGNLDVARWKDKQGGDHSKVVVKASRIQRLDWDESEARPGGQGGDRRPAQGERAATPGEPQRGLDAGPVDEDDIPF